MTRRRRTRIPGTARRRPTRRGGMLGVLAAAAAAAWAVRTRRR